ncbi:MAG: ferredoxin [Rhizobiales bacterium]|nr:ferredoxin [Hyphomicrobiales bacterium]
MSTPKARLSADQGVCVGSGRCVAIAPGLFDQREDDGIVEVVAADVPPELIEPARRAVAGCPARAIRLIEE